MTALGLVTGGVTAVAAPVFGALGGVAGAAANKLGLPLVVEGGARLGTTLATEGMFFDFAMQSGEIGMGRREHYDVNRTLMAGVGGVVLGGVLGAGGAYAEFGAEALAFRTPAPWARRAGRWMGEALADETGSWSLRTRNRGLVEQWRRNRAASAIRAFRRDMRRLGTRTADLNSYVRAFELQSFRYGRNLNPFKRFFRHFNRGGRAGGPWLHDTRSLLDASPAVRKRLLALPASNAADGSAYTYIPFGRKVATGTTAPQPSSFTGLPPGVRTGGVRQWFVSGGPYLDFAELP